MKRVAVFAHYDKNNLIEDYVVYFLSELKKVAEKIVFVSDSNVKDSELKKINTYIEKAIIGTHGEYDFGSYKRGYIWAKENGLLDNCEEFILVNDSCYAPLFPFSDMFNEMSNRPVDFWGATQNGKFTENKNIHIQSYFIVLKPQVFNSIFFNNFISNIKKEENKEDIVHKYEIGLSQLLINNHYKFDVYSKLSKKEENAYLEQYKQLIKEEKLPFLKRSITLLKEQKTVYPLFLNKFLKKYTDYDYSLSEKDTHRNKNKLNFILYIKFLRKQTISINLRKKRIVILCKEYRLKNANE